MILAVSTLLYIYENLNNGLDFSDILKTKISNIELSFPVHANDLVLEKLKNLNLKVFSAHSDFINTDISSLNAAQNKISLRLFKERIKFLKKAGGKILIVHPGHYCESAEEKNKRISISIENLIKLASFAQDENVVIAIENMPNKFIAETPGEHIYIIEEIRKKIKNKKTVAMCLDSGHAFLTGSLNEYYDKYLEEIVSMHIHDNLGDINHSYLHASDDLHLPPGKGAIGWKKFLDAIKKKYSGGFVFEVIPKENSSNIIELLNDLKVFIDNNL